MAERPEAYATSRDGLSWERPTLGIGRGNQIIPDMHPTRAALLWIMMLRQRGAIKSISVRRTIKAEKNIYGYTAISADGIHWNNLALSGSSGDRSTMFYNPFRKKYVFSLHNGGGLGPVA